MHIREVVENYEKGLLSRDDFVSILGKFHYRPIRLQLTGPSSTAPEQPQELPEDISDTWEELRRLVTDEQRVSQSDFEAILTIRNVLCEQWLARRQQTR